MIYFTGWPFTCNEPPNDVGPFHLSARDRDNPIASIVQTTARITCLAIGYYALIGIDNTPILQCRQDLVRRLDRD